MNREDIIRMAREAGFEELGTNANDWVCFGDEIERFAALVASKRDLHWHQIVHDTCEEAVKAEREACAKVCERDDSMRWSGAPAAIRARSNT